MSASEPSQPTAVTPPPESERNPAGKSRGKKAGSKKEIGESQSEAGEVVTCDDDGEPLYLIDRILEERSRRVGKDKYTREYRVKWHGYDEDHEECQKWCPADWLTQYAIRKFRQDKKKRLAATASTQAKKRLKTQTNKHQHDFDDLPGILVGLEEANSATSSEFDLSYKELEQVEKRYHKPVEKQPTHKSSPRKPRTPPGNNAKKNKTTERIPRNRGTDKSKEAQSSEKQNTKYKARSKGKEAHPSGDPRNGNIVDVDEDGSEWYELESVWDYRIVRGVHQYRVKWVNCDNQDTEWIPEDEFSEDCSSMLHDFRMRQEKELAAEKLKRAAEATSLLTQKSERLREAETRATATPTSTKTPSVTRPTLANNKPAKECNLKRPPGDDSPGDFNVQRSSPDLHPARAMLQPGALANNTTRNDETINESFIDGTDPKFFRDLVKAHFQRLAECPSCGKGFASEPIARTPIMSRGCQHTVCVQCVTTTTRGLGNGNWAHCPVRGCRKEGCFSSKTPNINRSLLSMIVGMNELLGR